MIGELKKSKRLVVGFNDVQTSICKKEDDDTELLIFVVNNSETEAINK